MRLHEKQPATHKSPSGAFALKVDPSDRMGVGSARYRLTRQGKEVWSGTRPYTLWDARVADDGTVAGYAYGAGLDGWAKNGNDFRVLILDPQGKDRLNVSEPRENSRFIHHPDTPIAAGLFIHPYADRFVLRINDPDVNRGIEEWRVFRLSTGKALGRYEPRIQMPDAPRGCWILAAEGVRGTPLTLVNWWDFRGSKVGAKFTLVDAEMKPVWTLNLPADYEGTGGSGNALQTEIREKGAIVDVSQLRAFTIRVAKTNEQVAYSVSSGRYGWGVIETGRRPYGGEKPTTPSEKTIPVRTLKLLRKFELKSPRHPVGPIRDVSALVSAGPGRLAFVREEPSGSFTLCVVDSRGTLLHSVPLSETWVQEERTRSHLAWSDADRFYVVRSNYAEDAKTMAWIVDAAKRTRTALPKLNCPWVEGISPLRDGGFVLLINHFQRYTSTHGVFAFDGKGKFRWRLYDARGFGDNDPAGRLFSPEAITVTSRNEVAVLDNIRNSIQFYDPKGKYLRTWELEKLWGRKPSYPTELSAAPNGGLVVYDFHAKNSVVAMDYAGKVTAQMRPRYADQREIEPRYGVICDDLGRVWLTDDHALLRLDRTGAVVETLGAPPAARVLTEIASLTMGPDERIYAVDARTHAVHRFSSNGKWETVLNPLPTDFDGRTMGANVTVARNGEIFLSGGSKGDIHFSRTGRRLGVQPYRDPDAPKPSAGAPIRWQGLTLLDAAGRVVTQAMRRADGVWLDRTSETSAAPDGSLAIMDSYLHEASKGPPHISLIAPDGKVLRSFPLPKSIRQSYWLAYDTTRVAVSSGPTVMVFRGDGKPQFTVSRKTRVDANQLPYLSSKGTVLTLFDGDRTLYRYALP